MMYLSGTSMATPAVSGAAALLFQANPKLTPTMAKMALQYSAQPLNGHNMMEQGAGQLNVDGAIKIANYIRQDVSFETLAKGSATNAAGASFPVASTNIGGDAFTWSQGILTNHAYIKGAKLISAFQNVYKNGNWFDEGINYAADGNQTLDTTNDYSIGLSLYQNVHQRQ